MKQSGQLQTPVVLIIFRRPEVTEKVFDIIRQVKPLKLFVAADGPRKDHVGDIEKCAAARKIVERVDWDCEVFKDYSDVNLGCGLRPASAIHWVFEHVEEAIILEDDCLPHLTFFRFCQELLEKYRDNSSVMGICGTDFEPASAYARRHKNKSFSSSYFFSRYFIPWGWATWQRAWKYHDLELNQFRSKVDQEWVHRYLEDPQEAEFWIRRLNKHVYDNPKPDAWDYQWQFSVWQQNGLYIIPKVNLISNIGFTQDATHGNSKPPRPSSAMEFPLQHPASVSRNQDLDRVVKFKLFRETTRKKIIKLIRGKIYRTKRKVKDLVSLL